MSEPKTTDTASAARAAAAAARMTPNIPYAGRAANLRLENDDVELILPTEIGPRVLRYALKGGTNLFAEISPDVQGNDTPFGDRWHIYGGHRLWYAPEDAVRTYHPDNAPVRAVPHEGGVTLIQAVEPHTKLEKAISVTLAPTGSAVAVSHRLTNRGDAPLELAPWALSVMAPGGRAIFPHARFVPHPEALAPARPLVLWPFTRMNDPRWSWGDRFLVLRQDPARKEPQKVGLYDEQGWMAYALGATLFIKRHLPKPGTHADLGCNVETFTNDAMLELESLGPLVTLAPGAAVTHEEQWLLFQNVDLGDDEAAIARALEPRLAAAPAFR